MRGWEKGGRACNNPGRPVEDVMTNFKYGVVGAAGLALMIGAASVSAQEITRVRGTIDKVDGNTLLVKSREGQNLTIKLKDGATVTGVAKAMLSDVKQNSFI